MTLRIWTNLALVLLLSGLHPSMAVADRGACVGIGLLRDMCAEPITKADPRLVTRPGARLTDPLLDRNWPGTLLDTLLDPGEAGLVADPVQAARDRAREECRRAGGTGLLRERPSPQMPDLNADGRADLVLSWSGFACDAGTDLFCGSDGCLHSFFVAQPLGYYREVYRDVVHHAYVDKDGRVTLIFDGVACDVPESHRCLKRIALTYEEAFSLD